MATPRDVEGAAADLCVCVLGSCVCLCQVFRQRIIQLETINVELEHRLEKQAKERMEVC